MIKWLGRLQQKVSSMPREDLIIHAAIILLLVVANSVNMEYILKKNFYFYIVNLFVQCGTIIAITYSHAFYFMPRFLNKESVLKYIAIMCLSIIAYMVITFSLDYYEMNILQITEERFYELNWRFILFRVIIISRFLLFAYLLHALNERFIQSKLIGQMKVEKLKSEIGQMKSQINPHFLFNTLNNIYGLALDKSGKTPEIILRLSKMMDYMLNESSEMFVYLNKDLDNVQDYVEMERIRNGNKGEIILDIQGGLGTQKVAPLMILPVVENAFKHGLSGLVEGAFVHIIIKVEGVSFDMKVNNNYMRRTDEPLPGHGLGLSGLKKRLELFYPGRHELVIDDYPPIFSVTLRFALNY